MDQKTISSISTTKRIHGLDFLKFVCAFFVICIHTTFSGKSVVEPVARIAVPLFFMITGYNYSQILAQNKQRDQLLKVLKLSVFANGLYMLWEVLMAILTSNFSDLIKSWLTPRVWIGFLLLNESPFSSRLWYVSALLYVLLIVYCLQKKGKRECLYKWIPFLLAINLVLGTYAPILFGRVVPLEYSRNFLFMGLPCFLLGDFLRKNTERTTFGKVPNRLLVTIFVLALFAAVAEQWVLTELGFLQNRDFYLSTIIVAISAFYLVIQHESAFKKGISGTIAMWGEKYSLGIYVYNKIVRECIYKPLTFLPQEMSFFVAILNALSPMVVLISSMIFVAFLFRVRDYITNFSRMSTGQ